MAVSFVVEVELAGAGSAEAEGEAAPSFLVDAHAVPQRHGAADGSRIRAAGRAGDVPEGGDREGKARAGAAVRAGIRDLAAGRSRCDLADGAAGPAAAAEDFPHVDRGPRAILAVIGAGEGTRGDAVGRAGELDLEHGGTRARLGDQQDGVVARLRQSRGALQAAVAADGGMTIAGTAERQRHAQVLARDAQIDLQRLAGPRRQHEPPLGDCRPCRWLGRGPILEGSAWPVRDPAGARIPGEVDVHGGRRLPGTELDAHRRHIRIVSPSAGCRPRPRVDHR